MSAVPVRVLAPLLGAALVLSLLMRYGSGRTDYLLPATTLDGAPAPHRSPFLLDRAGTVGFVLLTVFNDLVPNFRYDFKHNFEWQDPEFIWALRKGSLSALRRFLPVRLSAVMGPDLPVMPNSKHLPTCDPENAESESDRDEIWEDAREG